MSIANMNYWSLLEEILRYHYFYENKEKVLDLALKGNEIATPSDVIKDP